MKCSQSLFGEVSNVHLNTSIVPDPIVLKLADLSTWSRNGQRALHKPLLVLYALGRWQRGDFNDIPFKVVTVDLTALLKAFGPPRKTFHPEYPFWRLQSDGVWNVQSDRPMKSRASNSDPKKSELLAANARGGFSAEVKFALKGCPNYVTAIASSLLNHHFPESHHSLILEAVGLTLEPFNHRNSIPSIGCQQAPKIGQ